MLFLNNKYKIQILVVKDMVTLKDIVNYVLEFASDGRGYNCSYYPTVQVGEYEFYDVIVEVKIQ